MWTTPRAARLPEVTEGEDAQTTTEIDQLVQDLGARLGIPPGSVLGTRRGPKVRGQRGQPDVADVLTQHSPGELHGADGRPGDRFVPGVDQIVIEEPVVERSVVRDEHRAAKELDQRRQDRADLRRPSDQEVVDPGEGGDERRDGNPGIDESVERPHPLATPVLHRTDLRDLGTRGGAAGGLEIDAGEGDVR
jgi:hypothetical protein